MKSQTRKVLLLLLACLSHTFYATAQHHPALRHTTLKLGSSDSIDLDTLNIQLSFPIINKSGRGVGVSFAVSYYGNFWKPSQGWTADYNFGWNFQPAETLGTLSEEEYEPYQCFAGDSNHEPLYEHRYGGRIYFDPLGIAHVFSGERTYSECSNSETQSYPTWTTTDGYSITAGNYLYDVSGNRVGIASVSDSNGNTYFAGGLDTTGTTPLTFTGLSGTGVTGSSVVYTYKDAYGADQTVTVGFTYFNVRTAFGSGMPEKIQSNVKLPTTITYPDGQYSLTYEQTPGYAGWTTARVASLTLPTGGVVSYDYSGGSLGTDGSTSKITRTTSDGSTVFTRTTSDPLVYPAYGPPMTAQVTVAPPLGNQTTYTFSGSWFNPWSTAGTYLYVPTAISDGVTTRSICYRFNLHVFSGPSDGSCSKSDLGYPILGRETTTTLDNGMVQLVKETYDTNGMPTDVTTSDIGASSPGLLAETTTQYATFNSIHDRPGHKAVTDGSTRASYVDYSYDNPNYLLTPTSGLSGRENIFGDRGNLNWVQYNGTVAESFWYDDAGQLVQKQDASGNYTNYKHDSTDTFLTETDLPGTAGNPGLVLKADYDLGSSALKSRTDANGHKITYDYDTSLRQTNETRDTATGGDGGTISRVHVSNTQFSVTASNGSGGTQETEQILDGYGRVIRSARKIVSAAGKPWVLSDTCYDADGRPYFESLPYTAANYTGGQVCSGSGDTIRYDGIGRLQTITHADGSVMSFAYKGRSTLRTEESNGSVHAAKISQVDGLGRLIAVCELSSTSLNRGGTVFSPVTCGLDYDFNSPTGFLTTYTYNLASHTTTSIQNALTGGGTGPLSQVRTWTTDAFGRASSESIPEASSKEILGPNGTAGQTTYTYEYNAIGLKVTRTKPQANTSSGSGSTVTETQFDALGRPQSVKYKTNGSSDADTPDISFSYDVSAANNSKNTKGRLTAVSSAHGSVFYSYTPNGQVASKAATLPNSLCNFTYQSYSYDLLGNLLKSSDDIGGSTTINTYDAAANPLGVTAALGSSSQTTVVQNLSYDAFGVSGAQFGNSLTEVVGRDVRGRTNSVSVSANGTSTYQYALNWNPNGSLGSASDSANGNWSYSYDDFNRLVSASQTGNNTTTYQYDVFGNRYPLNNGSGGSTSTSFTYDLHNHNSVFGYDRDGNTVATPLVDSDFDAEGRVVRVRTHNGASVVAAYAYGPDGDRILATRGSKTTEYFYGIDGDLRLARVNGVAMKVPVTTPIGQVASFVAGQLQYEFRDWNGSSRIAASTAGAVLKTFRSDAFGGSSNAGTDDIAQVNELDVDVDAYSAHAGARDYYPSFGVWNAPDPFSGSYDFDDPQSFNRYAYVSNSPVSYNDPTGLARSSALWEGDGYTGSESASFGSGSWASTQAAGVCKNPLCWVVSKLRAGTTRIGSFLANNGSDGSFDPEAFSRFASATSGGLSGHLAQEASENKSVRSSVVSNGYSVDKVNRGLFIKLTATVTGGNFAGINWIQYYKTNTPTSASANVWTLDTDPGQKTPFYYNPSEEAQFTVKIGSSAVSSTFVDTPRRPDKINVTWRARLSLVGRREDGSYVRLRSFTYGFEINSTGSVTALPLEEVDR